MLDHLIHFVNLIGHWGYLVVILVIMLECQTLLGLFIPGETLVLAAAAAGLAWLVLCLTAVDTLRRYNDHLTQK